MTKPQRSLTRTLFHASVLSDKFSFIIASFQVFIPIHDINQLVHKLLPIDWYYYLECFLQRQFQYLGGSFFQCNMKHTCRMDGSNKFIEYRSHFWNYHYSRYSTSCLFQLIPILMLNPASSVLGIV